MHFKSLISSAVKCCLELGYGSIIDHVLLILRSKDKSDNEAIDSQSLKMMIEWIEDICLDGDYAVLMDEMERNH